MTEGTCMAAAGACEPATGHPRQPRVRADLTTVLRATWGDPSVQVGDPVPFGDGHSGFTYRVGVTRAAGAIEAVLRLSPPGVRIAGPADIGRQGRIMAALGAVHLPVPAVFASSSGPVIDGRSFALLELLEGTGWEQAAAATSDLAVAEAAVGALRAVAASGRGNSGIADEEPTGPAGEARRWAALLPRCPDWIAEPGEVLAAELLAVAPESAAATLVHGDFHFGNLIFRGDRVIGILDWEIASLGDPRLDVGSLAVAVMRRRYRDEPNSAGALRISARDLVALWGADETMPWFVAASCLKYAAILSYNLMVHRSGRRPDPIYEQLRMTMRGLIDDGRSILHEGLPSQVF
jgi:aminoglycoside phosphotransferase (APT) family kinase protein